MLNPFVQRCDTSKIPFSPYMHFAAATQGVTPDVAAAAAAAAANSAAAVAVEPPAVTKIFLLTGKERK